MASNDGHNSKIPRCDVFEYLLPQTPSNHSAGEMQIENSVQHSLPVVVPPVNLPLISDVTNNMLQATLQEGLDSYAELYVAAVRKYYTNKGALDTFQQHKENNTLPTDLSNRRPIIWTAAPTTISADKVAALNSEAAELHQKMCLELYRKRGVLLEEDLTTCFTTLSQLLEVDSLIKYFIDNYNIPREYIPTDIFAYLNAKTHHRVEAIKNSYLNRPNVKSTSSNVATDSNVATVESLANSIKTLQDQLKQLQLNNGSTSHPQGQKNPTGSGTNSTSTKANGRRQNVQSPSRLVSRSSNPQACISQESTSKQSTSTAPRGSVQGNQTISRSQTPKVTTQSKQKPRKS